MDSKETTTTTTRPATCTPILPDLPTWQDKALFCVERVRRSARHVCRRLGLPYDSWEEVEAEALLLLCRKVWRMHRAGDRVLSTFWLAYRAAARWLRFLGRDGLPLSYVYDGDDPPVPCHRTRQPGPPALEPDGLDPELLAMIRLRQDGKTLAEVARELDTDRGWVRNRLRQAKPWLTGEECRPHPHAPRDERLDLELNDLQAGYATEGRVMPDGHVVRLRAVQVFGRWRTSTEEWQLFVRTTYVPPEDLPPPPEQPRTPAQVRRQERARRELERMGAR